MNLLKQNECIEMFCCLTYEELVLLDQECSEHKYCIVSILFLGVVYTDIAFMNNTYVLPLLLVVEEY